MITKEEVLKSLEKRAKQLEFSIEMFTKTIGEITLLNDGRDHKVAISELARGVMENRQERTALLSILSGEYNIQVMRGLQLPDEYIQALLPDIDNEVNESEEVCPHCGKNPCECEQAPEEPEAEQEEDPLKEIFSICDDCHSAVCDEDSCPYFNLRGKRFEKSERLPNGVVGQICGYDIYEPIMERNFVVTFPKEFGISEVDVMSYKVFSNGITVKIRNNITRPLLRIEKLLKIKDFKDMKIVISTLDATGCSLYDIEYDVAEVGPYEISGGDYKSNEPQIITLTLLVHKHEIIDTLQDKI